MKLSVELGKWRIDRPDEWKMDEFMRNAEKLEAQNAELVAKIQAFGSLIHEATNGEDAEAIASDGQITGYVVGYDWLGKVGEAIEIAPTQHLRDIRAEAGRAGFIEGYDSCWFQHYGTRAPEHATAYSADQYAASVKAGEK